MPSVSIKDLLEAGVHFGHQTKKWNPKVKPPTPYQAMRMVLNLDHPGWDRLDRKYREG